MIIDVEYTPNPNAKKFIFDASISKYRIYKQYNSVEDTEENLLAKKLFSLDGVQNVFFLNDFITITKDEDTNWRILENGVKQVITENISEGEEVTTQAKSEVVNEQLKKINEILDDNVRPGLAMDGGGLEVVDLTEDLTLSVKYHGACGSCPSSTYATLNAINMILKETFHPDIEVIAV